MTGFSFADESLSPSSKSGLVGTAGVRGPAWARMPLLTMAMMGLQIVWSVEMAWASPYLHDDLGVKKSLVAMVFLAGPISGLVVQPLIGVLADRSTSRFGRRRPFIAMGGIVCIFGVLVMGYTRKISGLFTTEGSSMNHALTVGLAVWSIFCIDFSINVVQAVDRALVVDVLPTRDQPLGSAWAAGMFGVGSVFGFYLGSAHLPRYLPFLGDSQLKVLASLASILFLVVHVVLTISVKEQRLLKGHREPGSFIGIFKDIWVNIRSLPYNIMQICLIQFFAWIAWFPFLFYMTIYISEIYTEAFENPTAEQMNEGTRLGNRAMFFQAICSLATSVIAPFTIREQGKTKPWAFVDLGILWSASLFLLAICLLSTFFIHSVGGVTVVAAFIGIAWAITQWAPFALLGEAILSTESPSEVARGSFESIPFTDRRTHRTSGENEIMRDEAQFLIGDHDDDEVGHPKPKDERLRRDSHEEDSMEGPDDDVPHSPRVINSLMQNSGARRSVSSVADSSRLPRRAGGIEDEDDLDLGSESEYSSMAAKAGIILGIHNVFIVIPQFLSTGMAAIVFKIYEPHRSVLNGPHPAPAQGHAPVGNVTSSPTPTVSSTMLLNRMEALDDSSPDALGVVLRIGGICALISSILAWRLSRILKQQRR